MWSNDAVAEDDPDDASPWTRDDWVPDSAVPDAALFGSRSQPRLGDDRMRDGVGVHEPPPEDFEDPDLGHARSTSFAGRKVVAGVIVAALLVGSAGALLRSEREPDGVPDTAPASAPADDPPRSTLSIGTTPPTSVRAVPNLGSLPAGQNVEIADRVPPVVVGQVPAWAERTIAVPEPLASMAPTEVVTLSEAGIVNVTEFPSGRTRSVDVSDIGAQAQLVVDDDSIVVFDSTTLWQIRDGKPVVETPLNDGIIFVQPWTGTGNFIATAPATGPEAPEQDWVLRPDGTRELLDNRFVDEVNYFSRAFTPDGEAVVTAPGGVYAIDSDGNARRISTGTLLATGSRHWAVEECDASLRCAYSVVEWDTGTVTPGLLEVLDNFGFIDPATSISPDGRSVIYRGDTNGLVQRMILDVATGTSLALGRSNVFVYPDSWAADSSGVFAADGLLQFVDRHGATVTEIEDLDRIRTVATRLVVR